MKPKQKKTDKRGGRHGGAIARKLIIGKSPWEIWKAARAGETPYDVRVLAECLMTLDVLTKEGQAMPDPITRKLAGCMLRLYRAKAGDKLRALADVVARGTYSADPLFEALVSLAMRAAEPGDPIEGILARSLKRIPKGQIIANLKAAGVCDVDDTTLRKALNQLGVQGKTGIKTAQK